MTNPKQAQYLLCDVPSENARNRHQLKRVTLTVESGQLTPSGEVTPMGHNAAASQVVSVGRYTATLSPHDQHWTVFRRCPVTKQSVTLSGYGYGRRIPKGYVREQIAILDALANKRYTPALEGEK